MLRNYLLVALRNLRKHRLYSFITIGGLAVGLAACLLILLFVRDELSYDTWLPNAERIAKLEVTFKVPGRETIEFGSTPGPAKAALEKDFSSDIERVVRIYVDGVPIRFGDRQFTDKVSFVDPGFFEVFDLPLARGQREQVLEDNTTILVSERMAEKYFGSEPAIGQVITVDNSMDFKVIGVFEELPRNTHLKLDFIARFDTERYVDKPWIAENWTSANVHTYVMLRSPAARERISADFKAFVNRNVQLEVPGLAQDMTSEFVSFNLMPLLDIHLHAKKEGYFKPGGDIVTVVTFSVIAGLILLIACINFVNLATARSMQRAREVAMRKVVGATRGQLVGQFLGEAILTAGIALLIAVALVEIALGPYNAFLDKQLSLNIAADPTLLAMMLGLVVVVGVIGGTYPAIYLSRFRPARVLKANQSSVSGSALLRNGLVIFQFSISIALIVATAVVYQQHRFARNLDVGFDTADKLVLQGLGNLPADAKVASTLEREVSGLASVRAASLSSDAPPLSNNNNTLLYPTPTPGQEQYLIENLYVDYDFFEVYGVEPLAGRVFSRDFAADKRSDGDEDGAGATQSVVVNEQFLTRFGIESPGEAIGKVFWEPSHRDPAAPYVRTTVVGVVPDMHLRSVRVEITPMVYFVRDEGHRVFSSLSLDVEPGQMAATLAAVNAIWDKLAPSVPIDTGFVDQKLAAQYDAIEQRGYMFAAFALFAVFVACLGLFGLASFAAERRTKEIGMRKALGASVLDIVRLLMWQFSKPVLIANAVAWPVAFYFMDRWLATFRYRIDLTEPALLVGVFLGAGVIALAISWLTVAGHATRVARASPIHALRCE